MDCISPRVCATICATILGASASIANAAPPVHASRDAVLDQRYGHDHHYPPLGQAIPSLPTGHYRTELHGVPYYFSGGVWYRPERSGWIVVTPPLGIVIPFLPPFYTTLWINGIPFYYVNNVYYAWRPELSGYVVVKPPAKDAEVSAQPRVSELYVYPKNDQSADRQATDRYECHRWAANESGFDPTLPLGGVPADRSSDDRANYFRALSACLEGRGYTVR